MSKSPFIKLDLPCTDLPAFIPGYEEILRRQHEFQISSQSGSSILLNIKTFNRKYNWSHRPLRPEFGLILGSSNARLVPSTQDRENLKKLKVQLLTNTHCTSLPWGFWMGGGDRKSIVIFISEGNRPHSRVDNKGFRFIHLFIFYTWLILFRVMGAGGWVVLFVYTESYCIPQLSRSTKKKT